MAGEIGLSLGLRQLDEAGSGATYHADAVHFDGSVDITNPSLTCVNSGFFAQCYWFRQASALSDTIWMSDKDNNAYSAMYYSSSKPRLVLDSPTGSFDYLSAVPSNNVWHSLLIAAKTSAVPASRFIKMYLDDADVTTLFQNDGAAFNSVFAGLEFMFGHDALFGITMDFADYWMAIGQNLFDGSGDIPVATRRKFVSAANKPVYLGADGSIPTGIAPTIFFSGDSASFGTNRGTGGAFTQTGSLTNASTSPSD